MKERACRIKELLQRISPLIEACTSRVCPDCEDICCRQRHAFFDRGDRVLHELLGEVEAVPGRAADDAPCEFLSAYGCIRERWQRPFRCTWFFCDPLLKYMEGSSGKKYREMVKILQDMVTLRGEMTDEGLGVG